MRVRSRSGAGLSLTMGGTIDCLVPHKRCHGGKNFPMRKDERFRFLKVRPQGHAMTFGRFVMKSQKYSFIIAIVFLALCIFCLPCAAAEGERNSEAALYPSVEPWEPDDPGRAGSAVYTYYIPYFLADSDYWTGVGLRNWSGTASASVTVYGMSDGGSVLGSQTKTIPAEGQTAFMMNPGEGWVKVSSNQALMGLGFVAMVHDDKLMFDIPFVSQPATTLYIPHVAQDATWDTTIFVCNPNGSQTTMYLTFFNAAGTVVSVSHGYILPANGSGKYPLSVFLGASASYDKGSIRITATQGVAAFALYHNLKTGDRSYAGISAVAPDTSTPCTYSLNPASASFGASGGTGTVAVTTSSPTCSWTALSNVAWMIHVTAGSSGTGNGTVSYSVEPYSGTGSRSGTLTIAGHTFTVTQTDCSFTISPISPPIASFNGDGGTGTVAVTASSPDCRWTAASNNSWLHVTSGFSGTGNRTVYYSVDPYYCTVDPYAVRRGTLTIAWETFTVRQTCTFP